MLARGTRVLGCIPPIRSVSPCVRAGLCVETIKPQSGVLSATRATSYLLGRPCYFYLQNEVLSGFHFFHRRATCHDTRST